MVYIHLLPDDHRVSHTLRMSHGLLRLLLRYFCLNETIFVLKCISFIHPPIPYYSHLQFFKPLSFSVIQNCKLPPDLQSPVLTGSPEPQAARPALHRSVTLSALAFLSLIFVLHPHMQATNLYTIPLAHQWPFLKKSPILDIGSGRKIPLLQCLQETLIPVSLLQNEKVLLCRYSEENTAFQNFLSEFR